MIRVYSTDKAIAAARDGFDEDRIVGGVAQHLAQASDGGVQSVIKVAVVIPGPERVTQLVAGDQIAGRLKQNSEHLKGLSGEPDFSTFLSQLLGVEVQFEVAKTYASTDR